MGLTRDPYHRKLADYTRFWRMANGESPWRRRRPRIGHELSAQVHIELRGIASYPEALANPARGHSSESLRMSRNSALCVPP